MTDDAKEAHRARLLVALNATKQWVIEQGVGSGRELDLDMILVWLIVLEMVLTMIKGVKEA